MDDALNARNPFAPDKPQEQLRQYGVSLSGTITPNKTSFSLNGGATSQYTSPILLAVLPDGTTVNDTIRQPRDAYNVSARLDHAITKDHAVRLSFDRDSSTSRNLVWEASTCWLEPTAVRRRPTCCACPRTARSDAGSSRKAGSN